MCVTVFVYMYLGIPYACWVPWRPEKGVKFSGTGVANDSQTPMWVLGMVWKSKCS